jgi:hypothetical protein
LRQRANVVGTKFGGGESEGGAGIPFPPTPFPSRPARAFRFGFCRAKRGNQSGFCSKKVRTLFSNCDQTKHCKFCEQRTLSPEKTKRLDWSQLLKEVRVF